MSKSGFIHWPSLGTVPLLLLLVAVLTACDPPTPQPEPATDEVVDPLADWVTITSKAGRFRVRMPTEPTTSMQRTSADRGAVVNHLAQSSSDGMLFAVSFSDLPAELVTDRKADILLEQAGLTAAQRVGGRVTQATRLEDAAVPTRDVSILVPGEPTARTMQARLLLVDHRLYQITVVGEGDFAQGDESVIDAYLESFEVRDE